MKDYRYVIIGGGMTADAAVSGIRKHDDDGSIAIISAEEDPPYNRPPLTKDLWKESSIDDIWCGTDDHGIDLYTGCKATALDTTRKTVTVDNGDLYTYDRLLLATGGSPKQLPFGNGHIHCYRTLEDYRQLRRQVNDGRRIAVIGGGFIGSELSAAIAMNDGGAVLIFPQAGIGGLIFPRELSDFLTDTYRDKGVQVLPETKAVGLTQRDKTLIIELESGDTVKADYVVAGIGITPNDTLAQNAAIEVDDGIMVDESLLTSSEDVFAAGDAARFYSSALDVRRRVEHEDHALKAGKLAGENMAGADKTYDYLPMFYSDLFDLGYEAVGETRADLDTFCHWQEPNHKGIIFYRHDHRVRGIIFWNVWDMVPRGRDLIARAQALSDDDLRHWCEGALSEA